MGKRGRGKEFDSRPFEVTTSFRTLEERQRRDLDRRLKVAHQKAEARKQKELQIKKEKKAIILELKKRRQNIAFEKSIKNASPVKSYAVFDEKRQREEINFQPESLMTGEHFASRLGEAFQKEVNDAKGLQKEVLISRLKSRFNSKEKSYPSSETFDDIGRRNFNKLISLIAKKAYLDLGIETDGKTYTKLESQISALSSKIARNGLPINLTFTFGSIRIRTSNLEEKGFQANPLFDWKLPKWAKLGGVSTATVATVIACGGEAPPEHAPAPVEEDGEGAEEIGKTAPVTEEVPTVKPAATEPPPMVVVELPTGAVTAEIPATAEAEEAYYAPTNWKDWDFENYTETERMTAENTQDGLRNMEANYISKFWRDGKLKNIETGEEAKDWEEADSIFRQKYSFVYQDNDGYTNADGTKVPYSWMIAVIDKNGEIVHAENTDGSQLPLFTAFAINDIDNFSFSEFDEMPEGGERQIIVVSKDGRSFTRVTLDADGNAIGWTDLVTGEMVKVKQIEFPAGLTIPDGAYYLDDTHIVGPEHTDENKKPLFVFFQEEGAEKGEWIRDFEKVNILNWRDQKFDLEKDIKSGDYYRWLEYRAQELEKTLDWDELKSQNLVQDWKYVSDPTGNQIVLWNYLGESAADNIQLRDPGISGYFVEKNSKGKDVIHVEVSFALIDLGTENVWPVQVSFVGEYKGEPLTKEKIDEELKELLNKMAVTPIRIVPELPHNLNGEISNLVSQTFIDNPDIKINNFDPMITEHKLDGLSGEKKFFATYVGPSEFFD